MGGAVGRSAVTSDPTFTAVYDSYKKALIVEFEAFDDLNHQRKGGIIQFILNYLCSCGLITENENELWERTLKALSTADWASCRSPSLTLNRVIALTQGAALKL